jgi:hypothetical protein
MAGAVVSAELFDGSSDRYQGGLKEESMPVSGAQNRCWIW